MSLLSEINDMLANNDDHFLYKRDWTVVENEVINEGRWSLTHRAIVTDGTDFVAVEYNTGATEYQDDTDLDGVAYGVYPKKVVVTKYVTFKEL